jgi:hypothetical protein
MSTPRPLPNDPGSLSGKQMYFCAPDRKTYSCAAVNLADPDIVSKGVCGKEPPACNQSTELIKSAGNNHVYCSNIVSGRHPYNWLFVRLTTRSYPKPAGRLDHNSAVSALRQTKGYREQRLYKKGSRKISGEISSSFSRSAANYWPGLPAISVHQMRPLHLFVRRCHFNLLVCICSSTLHTYGTDSVSGVYYKYFVSPSYL